VKPSASPLAEEGECTRRTREVRVRSEADTATVVEGRRKRGSWAEEEARERERGRRGGGVARPVAWETGGRDGE